MTGWNGIILCTFQPFKPFNRTHCTSNIFVIILKMCLNQIFAAFVIRAFFRREWSECSRTHFCVSNIDGVWNHKAITHYSLLKWHGSWNWVLTIHIVHFVEIGIVREIWVVRNNAKWVQLFRWLCRVRSENNHLILSVKLFIVVMKWLYK